MIHKCAYAELIGATPQWITDSEDGREVCIYCSEPKITPKAAPVKAPAKPVRKSA